MCASSDVHETLGKVYFAKTTLINDLGEYDADGEFTWQAQTVKVPESQLGIAEALSLNPPEGIDLSVTDFSFGNQVLAQSQGANAMPIRKMKGYDMEIGAFYQYLETYNKSTFETRCVVLLGAYKAVADRFGGSDRDDPKRVQQNQDVASTGAFKCAIAHVQTWLTYSKFISNTSPERKLASIISWFADADDYRKTREKITQV